MWKVLILASFLLSGCGGPGDAIEACETFVKSRLRSPSTYLRIKADQFIEVDGKQGWVSVEYDAANAYGTPIRDKQICSFLTQEGKWPSLSEMTRRAELAAVAYGDGTCCDASAAAVVDEAADLINDALDVTEVDVIETDAREATKQADAR